MAGSDASSTAVASTGPGRGERTCQTLAVADDRLILSIPDAPWLPAGSAAEAWAGHDCPVPDPCIIVRLLLVRRAAGGPEFFCVPTYRGLDLPSLPLSTGSTVMTTGSGIASLASATLGRSGGGWRCVGYIRNVVPDPDTDYPHPTPWAHVPVFVPAEVTEPVCDGSWLSLGEARPELEVRHWWPVVEHHITTTLSR